MRFLKVSEVAEVLQCSDYTVKQMIMAGKLHAVRLGGTDNGDYRIAEVALVELGVGGLRPIVIGVLTGSITAPTTGSPEQPIDTPGTRSRRGKGNA